MATSPRERDELLSRPAFRELLAFERDAHRRLLSCTDRLARGELYRSLYARWGTLARAAFEDPAASPAADGRLGFNDVFVRWCAPWLRGRTVLEIGCGTGAASEAIARLARDVTGLDVDSGAIELARRAVPSVRFVAASLTDPLPLDDDSVDTVYWNDVAEHLHPDDLDYALDQVRRVLRSGGHLLTVTCHQDDGPHDATMATGETGTPPAGMHLQEFTYRRFRQLLARHGFDARHALVGISALTRLGLLPLLPRLLVRGGPVTWVEGSGLSRRSKLVRWASGANVVFAVAQRRLAGR